MRAYYSKVDKNWSIKNEDDYIDYKKKNIKNR